MAQTAIESEGASTDSAGMRCQYCEEKISGQPFYAMRDVVRNAAGMFVPTADADAFCDVHCQRAHSGGEGTE